MGETKSDSPKAKGKVGGIVFFSALLALSLVSIVTLSSLPAAFNLQSTRPTALFLGASFIGAWCAARFIQGTLSVFLHELRHSVLSNLSGNRAKAMKVHTHSGSFSYEYTKRTAHMNSFIALAPYWLPLITLPTILVSALFLHDRHILMVIPVGLAFGCDLVLNLRDISPYQTDLSGIRGGFWIAVWYITAMNLSLGAALLLWVFQDVQGVILLGSSLWGVGQTVLDIVR